MPFTNPAVDDLQVWEWESSRPAIYGKYAASGSPAPACDSYVVPKWLKAVGNPQEPVDVDSISKTVEATFQALEKSGPTGIDLQGLVPDGVQGEHLVAVLRVTFRWRQQVPGWQQALAVAEAALTKQGLDARDALTGLI
jgi:hypothetical protein